MSEAERKEAQQVAKERQNLLLGRSDSSGSVNDGDGERSAFFTWWLLASLPNNTMHQEQKNRSLIAAGFAGTTVLGVVALTVPFVFLPTARKGLPYMATPAHKLQKALQFLQQRGRSHTNNSRPPQQRVFVDLGSGDGEGVYQAVQLADHDHNKNARRHPHITTTTNLALALNSMRPSSF